MNDRLYDWMPHLLATWRRASSAVDPEADLNALSAAEETRIVAAIERLSDGLTGERPLVGERYLDDPDLLGAYLLFYWPVSYAQFRAVLAELPHPCGHVLDLGAGPGPGTFAALDRSAAAGARGAAVVADRAVNALAAVRQLATARPDADLTTVQWQVGDPIPQGPFDTILVGHLLNEVPGGATARAALVGTLLDRLARGGSVVLLEPALRETSRALLEVRDQLVASGVAVRAPCLYRAGCPALERDSDWCHAERPLDAPPLVARLAQRARVNRDRIKMTYLILAARESKWADPPEVPPEARIYRIVSEPLRQKGRMRYMGCGPSGRTLIGLLDRHLSDENQDFERLDRGDLISVDKVRETGEGLRLSEHSNVHVLKRAGEPGSAR
jgi:ribosomal protein RSM22 (predicted rRNA methylase)